MSDNEYYNLTFNKLNSSFNFLYYNYSSNKDIVLNNISFNNLDDTVNINNHNISINDSINLINSFRYNKKINISKEVNLTNNINKSVVDPKLNNLINTSSNNTIINKSFVNNSSNIHHNTTNLVNLSTDKDKHDVVLFNDNLHNQNQYNKTFKLLNLNHSINKDPIFNNKKLNNSKSNSNICDDSREDNFLINPVPESDNKDNMMFLILPVLLVLLGAIIVYKIKK